MVFKRFVEVGRVALVADGVDKGKLCVIIDVINQRTALVDGPCTGVRRQAMNFNKLWLTDFKIRISPSAREKQVRKRFVEGDIGAKWEKTSWAKKIAMKNKRKTLTDFHRFKLKVLKQQKSRILRGKFNEMKHELKNSS
ncbi:60S ribosomal protein L14 [Geodia barretti]|uniref:Large ribosomal subunit protein eL14 n=1 Tax=Geodia barretti TaxID=519541 RepID=A0AA35SPD4_GEOBA|nr:60S ribosomal protein L14 [Geodia barretti]